MWPMKAEMAEPTRAAVSGTLRPWSPRALTEQLRLPLFRNAAYLWLNTIVVAASGFVFWMAAARLYPADAVGYGASAIAALTLIGRFSHLGLGIGVIRFLPERRDSAVGLVNSVFVVTIVASIVASVVFLLGLDLWAPGLKMIRGHPVFFAIFVAGATGLSLSYVLDQVFAATRRAHFVLGKSLGMGALRLVLVVGLATFFASFGIVGAHAIAGGLMVALALIALLPAAWKRYRPALEWKPMEIRSMASYAAGNYVGALLLLAPGSLFALIVLNTRGPDEAAYFYIAWAIGAVASALAIALSTSLLAEGANDPEQLRSQAAKAALGGTALALLVALVLASGAETILAAFGSDYASNGAGLLRLLAFAGVPYLLVNVYLGVARVQKRMAPIVLVPGTMAVVSLAAGSVFIGRLGIEAMGVAWLAGQVCALVLAAFYWRHLPTPSDRRSGQLTLASGRKQQGGGL